jgi:hypothetical protein
MRCEPLLVLFVCFCSKRRALLSMTLGFFISLCVFFRTRVFFQPCSSWHALIGARVFFRACIHLHWQVQPTSTNVPDSLLGTWLVPSFFIPTCSEGFKCIYLQSYHMHSIAIVLTSIYNEHALRRLLASPSSLTL